MFDWLIEFIGSYDTKQFLSAFFVLFAIIDIVGTIPIVINLHKSGHSVSASRAAIISLCLFIGFMYMGYNFLNLFGLKLSRLPLPVQLLYL